ncbi:hypothetical protein LSAT2_026341 [Lamellibrachia satsuma]|nr:hypothetical protein LSAT2_026341 [Lamellibrachia satsuma]
MDGREDQSHTGIQKEEHTFAGKGETRLLKLVLEQCSCIHHSNDKHPVNRTLAAYSRAAEQHRAQMVTQMQHSCDISI